MSWASTATLEGGELVHRYVVDFEEIDQTQVAIAGGKGAHLGELSRIEGIRVPASFCVTTDAFQRIVVRLPPSRPRPTPGLFLTASSPALTPGPAGD